MTDSIAADYSNCPVLVSTDWVDKHQGDPQVRLVEVDADDTAYASGHVPGAVGWSWQTQLCDTLRRDILRRTDFDRLASRAGIANDSTVVFYGEHSNWFACYAFWQLKLYGHADARIMNGGRTLWVAEHRPLTTAVPEPVPTAYASREPDLSVRAFRDEVTASIRGGNINLIDVRSPEEYVGKVIAPPGMTETAQRAGHIPRAINVPWSLTLNGDGTFKTRDELKQLYQTHGITPYQETIAYCRIGERSAHSWFVLKYLLGYPAVKNYDGSWTEWGNLVNAPIVRGDRPV